MTTFTAAEVGSIANAARVLLRDFPTYFEVSLPASPRPTIKLPHPMIASIDVWDIGSNSEVAADSLSLDSRNGVLKLLGNRSAYTSGGLFIQGFHYEWFLNEDLGFYSGYVLNEHMFERESDITSFDSFSAVEQNVMAMGTVVLALMSLLSEFSTQIDVSSPEGMMIPAHQRYQQVTTMYQYWSAKYEEDAAMLNVGLDRISMRSLRRISRMTNRLVPLFEEQEIDDPRPPMRVFPPIPPVSPDAAGTPAGAPTVGEIGMWDTMGTSGG